MRRGVRTAPRGRPRPHRDRARAPPLEPAERRRSRLAPPSPSPGALLLVLCAVAPSALAQADSPQGGPGVASAPSPELGGHEIVASEGVTLAEIARRELGSSGFAPFLAERNGLAVDAPLEAGQSVRIPIAGRARAAVGRVLFAKGEVRRGGDPLERGASVATNDTIVTGEDGFASIELPPDAVVSVQPNSRARVVQLLCLEADDSCLVEIDVRRGALGSELPERGRRRFRFVITTPFASAAARGTAFDTLVGTRELRTAVIDGTVRVEARGASRELDAGFGAIASRDGAPGDPIALLPALELRAVPTRVAGGDALAWSAHSGAEGYRVCLAADGEGAPYTDIGADLTRYEIPSELGAGRYRFVLRGVDAHGLPGLPSTTPLSLVALDSSVAPVEVAVRRDGAGFRVEVLDPPEGVDGFEIQGATTPDFIEPISVDLSGTTRTVLEVDAGTLYARARALIDPQTVSAFGPVARSH